MPQTVIDNVLTNYLDINPQSKYTLIILHGWGQNSSHWQTTSKLIDPSIHILILDLPGFGNTQPLKNNPNIPEYSLFIKNFIDKLNLNQPSLLGHSFGGQIATDFSLKHPEIVNKLILVAPAIIREKNLLAKLKITLAKLTNSITKILPQTIRESLISTLSPSDYSRSNKYQRILLKNIVNYNLRDKLHLIKTKTQIIWGSEDHVIPYQGKLLVETIPDPKLRVLYGAEHSIQLTHPDKLANLINLFIKHD